MTTDRPIIFSAPMVRGLLREADHPGTGKTQTRRIINPQPVSYQNKYCTRLRWFDRKGRERGDAAAEGSPSPSFIFTPYAPGDKLWVRERYHVRPGTSAHPAFSYAEEEDQSVLGGFKFLRFVPRHVADDPPKFGWHPSIHMPRWASRLTLTVTDVRVQRLQEISERDAKAEGTELTETVRGLRVWHASHRAAYAALWNSLHDPGAWDANPWIVALTFSVAHGNIDALPQRRIEKARAG